MVVNMVQTFAVTVSPLEGDALALRLKEAELQRLERKIESKKQKLSLLQTEIAAFFIRYNAHVGGLYAELEAITSQISELLRSAIPQESLREMEELFQETMRQQSREAHREAQREAREARRLEEPKKTQPSFDLKKLYRVACRRVHPDRARTDVDRKRRNRFMAEINRAYKSGDPLRVQELLQEYEAEADTTSQDSFSSKLMRLMARIANAVTQLRAVKKEIREVKASPMYRMKQEYEAEERMGYDPFEELADRLRAEISVTRRHLEKMKKARASSNYDPEAFVERFS